MRHAFYEDSAEEIDKKTSDNLENFDQAENNEECDIEN